VWSQSKNGRLGLTMGKPMLAALIPTEFEEQIERLGLTYQTCAGSERLRQWCERNKKRCYVPEWLLKLTAVLFLFAQREGRIATDGRERR
jgi:hypothetical protein